MARFVKKPVVVEAIQFDGSRASFDAIWDWMDGDNVASPMLGHSGPDDDHPTSFGIRTLEGRTQAVAGDWIIKGIRGEFYPCKPDIFAATYDAVKE